MRTLSPKQSSGVLEAGQLCGGQTGRRLLLGYSFTVHTENSQQERTFQGGVTKGAGDTGLVYLEHDGSHGSPGLHVGAKDLRFDIASLVL